MVSSTATKLGVLGKWTIARKVARIIRPPEQRGFESCQVQTFSVYV